MSKNRNTLIALGLAAFAFYKYKKMTPAEKEKLKNQANDFKKKILTKLDEIKKEVKM